jgi:hypothetical protein
MRKTSLTMMTAGAALIVVSLLWPLVAGRGGWTPEKASEHSQVSRELQGLLHGHGHGAGHEAGHETDHGAGHGEPAARDKAEFDRRLEEARRRYNASKAQFDHSAFVRNPRGLASWLRIFGVVLALGGGAAWFAARAQAT